MQFFWEQFALVHATEETCKKNVGTCLVNYFGSKGCHVILYFNYYIRSDTVLYVNFLTLNIYKGDFENLCLRFKEFASTIKYQDGFCGNAKDILEKECIVADNAETLANAILEKLNSLGTAKLVCKGYVSHVAKWPSPPKECVSYSGLSIAATCLSVLALLGVGGLIIMKFMNRNSK